MSVRARIDARVQKLARKRATPVVNSILPWIENKTEPMLDFGCGLGHIGSMLASRTGRDIEYLDVKTYPFSSPGIQVTLFDGKYTPYPDNAFDTTIINFVLHHTPDPQASLAEAARVTKKEIILCEDLLESRDKFLSQAIKDTIANCFSPHMTFQYRTESEWEEVFSRLSLTVEDKSYFNSWFIFNFEHISWLLSVNK